MNGGHVGYRVPERTTQALAAAQTVAELQDAAISFLRDVGFQDGTYHLARAKPYAENLKTVFSSCSQDWLARYAERGYGRQDHLNKVAQQTVLPILWLPRRPEPLSYESARIFREAREFGICDGISVPVHGPDALGLFTAVAGGTEAERRETIDSARDAVVTLGLYVHEYAATLLPADFDALGEASPRLTPRERECLQWVSLGKTGADIAAILNISEPTVRHFIAEARAKLNAATRAHAAVKAIRLGLIDGP